MARKSGKRLQSSRSKTTARKRSKSSQRIVAPVGKKRRQEIKELSRYIPSLEKLKGKRGLTASELGQLTRAKKKLRYTENLRPLTEKQAKKLQKMGQGNAIVGNGIRALRLNNTSPHAKIRVNKNGVIVVSNGRNWGYHPAKDTDAKSVADLGEKLLKQLDVSGISLWTVKGRANEVFSYPKEWFEWVTAYYQGYAQTDDWVLGVAFLIAEKNFERKFASMQEEARYVKAQSEGRIDPKTGEIIPPKSKNSKRKPKSKNSKRKPKSKNSKRKPKSKNSKRKPKSKDDK
jgi:hypothetical protein